MDQFISALPALIRASGSAQEVIEAAVLAVWNHVAGHGLRLQTAAVGLQNKKLTVAVSDSVWQRQLELMSGQFLFRLNALLGQGTVRFVEFRVDPKTVETGRTQNLQQDQKRDTEASTAPISLELVAAAASIHDPNLRRSFLGAASSCVRRRESTQS